MSSLRWSPSDEGWGLRLTELIDFFQKLGPRRVGQGREPCGIQILGKVNEFVAFCFNSWLIVVLNYKQT